MIQHQSHVKVKDNIENFLNSIGYRGSDGVSNIGKIGNVATIFEVQTTGHKVKFAKICIEEKKARQAYTTNGGTKKFKMVVVRKEEIFNCPVDCLEIVDKPKEERIVKPVKLKKAETRLDTIKNCIECNGNPKTYEKEICGISCVLCEICLEVCSYIKPEKKKRKK